MDYFLDVVLPIPLERRFTYTISEQEAAFIKPGMRVAVPFGKAKIYTAIAYQVHTEAPIAYEAKEIHQILDEHPLVTTNQLKHWNGLPSITCALWEKWSAVPCPVHFYWRARP